MDPSEIDRGYNSQMLSYRQPIPSGKRGPRRETIRRDRHHVFSQDK
jgi:hypothetical protein